MAVVESKTFVVETLGDVAQFFGRGIDAIAKWRRSGSMPGKPGAWPLDEIVRWRLDGDDESDPADESLEIEKLRAEIAKLKADTSGKELKNESVRGRLIDRADAEQSQGELCAMIRTRLESLPDEFEMRFPAETRAENKADFADEVRRVLKEMSEWSPE